MSKELCYVVDINNNPLSPTTYNKGWVLIRKGKAEIVSRLPFIIRLKRKQVNTDNNNNIVGIDTGSLHTGIACVSENNTKNKVLFKGTIEHKQDVKKKMVIRKINRQYRRSHKRHRPVRFNNRASSKRKGRIPPSIKTKKDEIIRVLIKLSEFLKIDKVIIEDVAIDIRVLQEGKKLYKWQYQKSNRLDENIRKATILRDNCKCQECGKSNCLLEVHHIVPRRLRGNDTVDNLIALCISCHDKTKGFEEKFIEKYQKKINGKNIRFDYAQHVMQGKTYLRESIESFYETGLTNGGDTANKRIDWNVEKSHANDACVITNLKIDNENCNLKDWKIIPLRRKTKIKNKSIFNVKHRDVIKYIKRNGEEYTGIITSIDNNKKSCNFSGIDNKQFKRYGIKNIKLIQRNKSINFI